MFLSNRIGDGLIADGFLDFVQVLTTKKTEKPNKIKASLVKRSCYSMSVILDYKIYIWTIIKRRFIFIITLNVNNRLYIFILIPKNYNLLC